MMYLLVFLGGGFGTLTRFGMTKLLNDFGSHFPYATLLSNVLASALLAFVVYHLPNKSGQEWLPYFVVIGFCGGFSTFSTFSHEMVLLLNNAQWLQAFLYLFVSILFGIGTIWMISAKM